MKIVILNGAKVNYDGIIDYSVLAEKEDQLVVFDTCEDHGYGEISEGAEVIISKELPISREDIMGLPDSVKLICEAGTGYNNIDLEACRERGIGVCNVPSYSSERVAHTAVMMMLMLASTMQTQIRMLAKGDHTNFDKCLSVPHVELNGKTLGVVGAGHIGRQTIAVGRALGIPAAMVDRQPFPGPGLAVRCIGELTKEKLDILREADYVFRSEMAKAKLDRKAQQFFAIMTNVKSTGVKNGARTFGYVIALRAVATQQFVKAGIVELPFKFMVKVAEKIATTVKGVNRVVWDITPKPPSTIEWE